MKHSTANRMALVCVLVCFTATSYILGQDPNIQKTSVPDPVAPHQYVYIVYLNPADRDCLPHYQERLDRVLTEIQTWYRNEMERNGFGPLTFPLERDGNGKLVIHVVKGTKAYKEGERITSSEKFDQVKGPLLKKGIDIDQEHIILISNTNFNSEKNGDIITHGWSDYVGGGNHQHGTAWVCDFVWLDPLNLPKKTPKIWDGGKYEYTLGRHVVTYIGGIAHEFGHSLGLPHNRESAEERAKYGVMLMGNGNYHLFLERTGDADKGAYLSKAHATVLSSHVLFTRNVDALEVKPEVQWYDIEFGCGDGIYTISGRIESNIPAYAVLAYHDDMDRPQDYDAQSWVADVNDDGKFKVKVGNLKPGFFASRLRCYFSNGAFRELKHHFPVDETLRIPAKSLARQTLFQLYARPAIEAKDPKLLLAGTQKLADMNDIYYQRAKAYLRNMTQEETPPKLDLNAIDDQTKEIPLSSVKWTNAAVEAGHAHVNRYWGITPLESSDTLHDHGIFAYGNSRYVYELDGTWKALVGSCGFQNLSGSEGLFIIKCDDKEVFRTKVIKDWKERPFEIDLTDVNRLELISDSHGFSWGDEAAWYSPVLKR
jgi:hypothetical protein